MHPHSTDLADLAAFQLAALYAAREASPVEVLAAVFRRIDQVNPALNAFVRIDHEGALAAARQSESRWMKGEALSVLDGVPVSIKDVILTRGMPTLRGSFTVVDDQAWD